MSATSSGAQRAVLGTLHQASDVFVASTSGRQCTAVAAVALCRLLLSGPYDWTSAEVDDCVTIGDRLYRTSRELLQQIPEAERHRDAIGNEEYLSPSEVHNIVPFLGGEVRFAVDPASEVMGHLRGHLGMQRPLEALRLAFQRHRACFLTTCGYTIAVYKDFYGQVWVFDSHCRGADGLLADDGAAVLFSLRDEEELARHLLLLYPEQTDKQQEVFWLFGVYVLPDEEGLTFRPGLVRDYADVLAAPPPVRQPVIAPQPRTRRREEWPELPASRPGPSWTSQRPPQARAVASPRPRRGKTSAPPPTGSSNAQDQTTTQPAASRTVPLSPPISLASDGDSDSDGTIQLRNWVAFHPELFGIQDSSTSAEAVPAAANDGRQSSASHTPVSVRVETATSGPSRAAAQPAVCHAGAVEANTSSESEPLPPKRGAGRPPKRQRGPKKSDLTLQEQWRKRSKKYREANPEASRDAARRYREAHPEASQDAARRFRKAHPEASQDAARRFREAHPEASQDAARRYREAHPAGSRDAARRYTEQHPEVHRAAVQRYDQQHPEQRQERAERYERETVRHLPNPLRRRGRLIGEYRGDDLKKVKTFNLKKQSLLSPDIYRCPHCRAPLFEEEKHRKAWCCRQGANNVLQQELELTPLDADIYSSNEFQQRPGRYNDAFAFSAVVIPGGWQHPTGGLSFMRMQGRMYHKVYDVNWRGPYPNMSAMYVDNGEERLQLAQDRQLDINLVLSISDFLATRNRLIPYFRQLGQMEAPNARLVFEETTRHEHGPLFEQRTSREVAALLATEEAPYNPRKITIWKNRPDTAPQNVHIFHPLYEAFQYPLLLPAGNVGWFPNRLDNYGNKLSQVDYVRCLLLSEPRFTQYGRLSETWLVDMYGRIEEERLRFHYREQEAGSSGTLRGAPRDELQAAVGGQQPGAAGGAAAPPAHRGRGRGRGRGSQSGAWAGRGRGRGRGQQPAASATPAAPGATPASSLPGNRRGVSSAVANDETVQGEGVVPGRIYLPQSFTGGPRYMKSKELDAMAIVTRRGKPHYFLTITANGQWPEVRQSVHPNNPSGEPMVVNRVFQLKLQELLRDLRSGAYFGKAVYIVYVIEFQKRGLPHAHICYRVDDAAAPTQNEAIDRFIRADIPSAEEDEGNLQRLVLKHMIHGPVCEGKACWDKDKRVCTKFFPKPHCETTHLDGRGFVQYCRDSTNTASKMVNRRAVQVSDCNVAPYNAALLKKFDCHINLEWASSRRVIKYLFKYLHKGCPVARTMVDGEEVDEIKIFTTQRYIGASDAAWRVLEFNMTYHEPAVIMLPVHDKDRDYILFEASRARDALDQSASKLTLYMKRPRVPVMENLTYAEFFERYRIVTKVPPNSRTPVYPYEDGKHFAKQRLVGGPDNVVTRMHWQDPSRGELFYLRMLLGRFPCRSHADLKALGGEGNNSYQVAARVVGLAGDDDEYRVALTEAHTFMVGRRLRAFFVTLLIFGSPAADLWADFKEMLCEDLLEEHPADPELAYRQALLQISRDLRRHGKTLNDFGLPVVEDHVTELGRERDELRRDAPELRAYVEEWEPRLSDEQRSILQYVRALSAQPAAEAAAASRVMYIDSPGGYGKSLLLEVVAKDARSRGEIVLCVASSAIAALNLSGGTTAHGMFGMPLDLGDGLGYWLLSGGSQRAQLIREASTIIFDEAAMAHRYLVEVLDRSLRDLMGPSASHLPFGGKTVIFAGDFRQIPPVVPGAKTPTDVIAASLRSSFLWPQMKVFHLTVPQRTGGNKEFAESLLKIGDDDMPHHIFGEEENLHRLIEIPYIEAASHLDELINFAFPPEVIVDPDACVSRAILSTHNSNVQEINAKILDSLPGEMHHLHSVDKKHGDDQEDLDVDQDTMHLATGKGVPNHVLDLKIGAVCTVMRNLNISERLVNGTKVIVESISPRLVRVRRPGSSDSIAIPRIAFVFPIYEGSGFKMSRLQFPLQVCYAMTVHKSQGQTIEKAALDLRSDVFTHGQLYVMLSRVRSPHDIRILVAPDRVERGVVYAKNIVYSELLLRPR